MSEHERILPLFGVPWFYIFKMVRLQIRGENSVGYNNYYSRGDIELFS